MDNDSVVQPELLNSEGTGPISDSTSTSVGVMPPMVTTSVAVVVNA